MSGLRDDFNKILLQAFSAVLKTYKEYPDDEHASVGEGYYADKLIAKMKTRIASCLPENPFFDAHANYCCNTGMIEMKKAIMEALE